MNTGVRIIIKEARENNVLHYLQLSQKANNLFMWSFENKTKSNAVKNQRIPQQSANMEYRC